MRKWIETTGRSEEDAIAAALFQLGLDRDDVSVEVIERAKSGFLGFGGNPAKVRVSYEVPGEEETPAAEDDPKAMKIREFLEGLMEHLNVQATPDIYRSETGYKVILQGHGLGAIIGRRGETLDAIQQLTNYSVNRGQSKRVRIHIDAEGYRAKREESLQRLAVKVAGKVVKYRKNMTLEPMNAYERHVIHAALQDYPNVTTYSTGVEPNRRTVVAYAPNGR